MWRAKIPSGFEEKFLFTKIEYLREYQFPSEILPQTFPARSPHIDIGCTQRISSTHFLSVEIFRKYSEFLRSPGIVARPMNYLEVKVAIVASRIAPISE